MKTDTEVLELLLKSFQNELAPVQMSWLERILYNPPCWPEVGFATRFSAPDESGHFSGDIVGVWRITLEAVEKMPDGFSVPEPDIFQSVYKYHYFCFTLPDTSGFGWTSSQSGPRCGIGGSYRVTEDGIEGAAGGWIS